MQNELPETITARTKPITLIYITNQQEIAVIAEDAGVDRIMVDLEIIGKQKRQANCNSVISKHTLEDIGPIRNRLNNAELMVRVNPIHPNTQDEVNSVIENGADIVMLPMYKTINEVERFLQIVDNRAKICLLLETSEAEDILESTLRLQGIDEIHIGLNDLHLSQGKKFMFELLADGTVDKICATISPFGIRYGFGGIGRIGSGLLPAELILAEHYRTGSQMAILSRSFFDTTKDPLLQDARRAFVEGVRKIRDYEKTLNSLDLQAFAAIHKEVVTQIEAIIA